MGARAQTVGLERDRNVQGVLGTAFTVTWRRTHGAARPHTATRRRAYQDGTLRPEWQCRPHGTARSGPSGSATHTATRRRTHGLHALTLPLDVERTKTVRSGPSESAIHMELHAQGRVAVPLTLPLDVERTGCTPSHCHSTSSVPRRCAQGRVAVPTTWNCTLRAEWQCRPHCHSTSSARAARPHTATRRRAYRNGASRAEWPGRRGARRGRLQARGSADHPGAASAGSPTRCARDLRPARSHPGCGPGLPDGREDANAAQKSMSTLLKNKFHSLSSGHIA